MADFILALCVAVVLWVVIGKVAIFREIERHHSRWIAGMNTTQIVAALLIWPNTVRKLRREAEGGES